MRTKKWRWWWRGARAIGRCSWELEKVKGKEQEKG